MDANISKRNTATNNTRRSLPDIPSEQVATNWEPTGDNSSEHYATVGQYQNSKRSALPNGIEPRPSISQHSSISQADDAFSPYERVKYDKIKSKEHPYAQLQPTTSRPIVVTEETPIIEERSNLLRNEQSTSEPQAPPRSRRSSSHSGGALDIPAASAVAGGIAASPDLPYMTPPVHQNFSGDSQDSSKGYTSISVREPLANIMAQTKDLKKQRELDPHYATVSDDSDDVYTTIPDSNNQIYTSESETYARIPPVPITVEAEINPVPSSSTASHNVSNEVIETDIGIYEPAPQPPPPSVDTLKQVAHAHTHHTHSRQASSSSSIANIGSPKPEKRQANSPLPPTPSMAANFDTHPEKHQVPSNLDELYAKVQKNKKDSGEKTPQKQKVKDSESSGRSIREHNYETLKKSPRNTSDPGYEKIKHEEPGYASINGPESIPSSDPGYEVLKTRAESESDPNYEVLHDKSSMLDDSSEGYSKIAPEPGYSVIQKKKKSKKVEEEEDEPNYESMPSESIYNHGSESDPNYESVKDLDPPYERLDEDSSRTDSFPGYEKVRKDYDANDTSESSNSAGKLSDDKSDPPYEQLSNDTDSEVPGYEKICKKQESTKKSEVLEDGIFQV